MNTIDILIEGYAKVTDKGWIASGTSTLIITDSGLRIISDPGANRELLLKVLADRGLIVDDVDFVFITHHHLDHAMLVGIFPKARIVDVEGLDWQAEATESPLAIPDTDISILAMPGHEYAHAILVVPTANGTVVVAGDTFWWPSSAKASEGQEEDLLNREKLISRHDDFAQNFDQLVESRKKVLDLADWVIPGHGKMWQNKKI